jgi:protein O-GlcNAc transferase
VRMRQKLAQNRKGSPLFDTPSYAKHLEAAYTEMFRCYQAGLFPGDIEVAP